MDATTTEVRTDEKPEVSLAETKARAGRFVEPGAAFETIDRETRGRNGAEQFDVIVIGAGQSGLSVGYYLSRLGLRFVILDAHARIGDVWRQRWDSLRLFTPARFCGLDGMRFPASAGYFPTKDEMGDFLGAYARAFDLPVRNGVRVDAVRHDGDRYIVEAGAARFEARHVHRLLSLDTPMGRKARPNFFAHGAPLVRVKARDLVAAGVRRIKRIGGVRDGQPALEDGRTVEVDNVIWCTGFGHGLDWVKRPTFDETGRPRQQRGVVEGEPGLYLVGLAFQHAPSSTMVHGVGRDARRVVEAIAARVRAMPAPSRVSA